jgi:hypothetical protein
MPGIWLVPIVLVGLSVQMIATLTMRQSCAGRHVSTLGGRVARLPVKHPCDKRTPGSWVPTGSPSDATVRTLARCLLNKEAAMAHQPGTTARGNDTPGTLAKFHVGLAADGTSCAMVFADEHQHSIACIASLSDLMGFIGSLQRVAAEMARRRTLSVEDDECGAQVSSGTVSGALNIASADFRMCTDDGYILGSLVAEGGQVVGIRMRPDVANEMTRNMLLSARAASAC